MLSKEKTIFIGADHAGVSMKAEIKNFLEQHGYKVKDLGTNSCESIDYPAIAHAVCRGVLQEGSLGILICGTGIGMSMAANKMDGIRAAVCTHEFHAKATRAHNNANVLCLGARVTATGMACDLTNLFVSTPYEGGRHERRIALLKPEQ